MKKRSCVLFRERKQAQANFVGKLERKVRIQSHYICSSVSVSEVVSTLRGYLERKRKNKLHVQLTKQRQTRVNRGDEQRPAS